METDDPLLDLRCGARIRGLLGRSFIRMLMKDAVEMPDAAWMKLQWMWIVFFIVVGIPEPRGGVPLLDRCMGKL